MLLFTLYPLFYQIVIFALCTLIQFMGVFFSEKMKTYAIISIAVALVAITVLKTSASKENSRGLTRLVGQQPLLFGRRGMNPNMNSLFFGKRAVDRSTLDDIIVDKCTRIMTACQEYAHERMGEDDI